jgi:hypothetical protein
MAGLDLLDPKYADLLREQNSEEANALAVARQSPYESQKYTAYKSGGAIADGLTQAAGGALGVDTRSPVEKYEEGIAKVREQIASEGLDATDPDKFYPRVIQLLAQNGLASQAAQMQVEYQKQKREGKRDALALQREERMARTDSARDARAKERNDIIAAKIPAGAKRDKILQYLDDLDATDNPERRTYLTSILSNLARGTLHFKDLNGELVIFNPDGSVLGRHDKSVSPDAALRDQTTRDLAQFRADTKALGLSEGADAQLKGPAATAVAGAHTLMAAVKHAYDEVTAYPSAVGWQNYMDFMDRVNRMDPEGVAARAAVGDVGSQLTHERYGAAVTGTEFQRASQFIPKNTDNHTTILDKLRNIYRSASEAANARRTTAGHPAVTYPDLPQFIPQEPTGEAPPAKREPPKLAPRQSKAAPATAAPTAATPVAAPAASGEDRVETWVRRNGKLVKE